MRIKNLSLLLVTLSSFLLTSCSIIASSIHYTKGTQYLQEKNYEAAIPHLKKAVELDPRMARNQGNLACAYLDIGEFDKAWYHSRQAVLLNNASTYDFYTFLEVHRIQLKDKGLDQKDTLIEDALCVLGNPDYKLFKDDGTIGLIYGCYLMIFSDGQLIHSELVLPDGI